MLTLFTVPRSFTGKYASLQLNALKSWLLLRPQIQIILFGDDPGTQEIAKAYHVDYIGKVERTKFGTPLLHDIFEKARQFARCQTLMYTNSDMLYLPDLIKSIKLVTFSQFLLIGRRYNLDIEHKLVLNKSWKEKLRERLQTESQLYKFGALDYFVFPKSVNFDMPPFAVGRTAWDNWMVYKARSLRIPVINASNIITAIHQNHAYEHVNGSRAAKFKQEKDRNWQLVGDRRKFFNSRDATHIMTRNGLHKTPFSFLRVVRSIEKFSVLNESLGFIAEPLVFIIRLFRFFRDKIRTFQNKL